MKLLNKRSKNMLLAAQRTQTPHQLASKHASLAFQDVKSQISNAMGTTTAEGEKNVETASSNSNLMKLKQRLM